MSGQAVISRSIIWRRSLWEILIIDDAVILRRKGAPAAVLEPRIQDLFGTSGPFTITFVARNVEFTRIPDR